MNMTKPAKSLKRTSVVLICALIVALAPSLSAHVIRSLGAPGFTSAFASSPTSGADLPIPIKWGANDTGHRVVCFNLANTSIERFDRPGWPRITGAGFELPGDPSGFSLLEPINGEWELVEGTQISLSGHTVTLDFAIVSDTNPTGRTPGEPKSPHGIPPGQAGVRGSGTRFCVSGPFPSEIISGQAATIEQILNGIVVGFHGGMGNDPGIDLGIWDNAARIIPLFP